MENAAPIQPEETSGLPARAAVLDILSEVLIRKRPLDDVLEVSTQFAALPPRDRAFARMATATTLRRLGQIDDIIRRTSERGALPEQPLLANILRLGIAQLLFMDVPDHAAVDTMVTIAENNGLSRQKGFVNAVLRRVGREGKDWLAKQDPVRLNTPEWLMKIWIADYGLRTAADIAQAHLSEAALDFTLKNPDQAERWAKELNAVVLPTGSLRRAEGGDVRSLVGFDEGAWWVQDAAAAMPAKLFGDVRGKTVVDLCAAPGGKTAQLAASGASVIALDRSVKRLERLTENVRRVGLESSVQTVVADASVWQPPELYDFVLLDAPCSATGTIRRHPDIPWLKTESDIARAAQTQARMIDNAVKMLKSGGVLVYCVCSLQKAEGERQTEATLKFHKSLSIDAIQPDEVKGLEACLTPFGELRIVPSALEGGIDGFYVVRLRKN